MLRAVPGGSSALNLPGSPGCSPSSWHAPHLLPWTVSASLPLQSPRPKCSAPFSKASPSFRAQCISSLSFTKPLFCAGSPAGRASSQQPRPRQLIAERTRDQAVLTGDRRTVRGCGCQRKDRRPPLWWGRGDGGQGPSRMDVIAQVTVATLTSLLVTQVGCGSTCLRQVPFGC